VTLREEHRLRVFENRVLRSIFGPRRVEMTGGRRKLRNEELHSLYSSLNIRKIKSRRMGWARRVARTGEMRSPYKISVGKPEGRSPLGRCRCRRQDIIKMDLREIEWECVDWIQGRNRLQAFLNTVMNVPWS
jgi:hypothetical protein